MNIDLHQTALKFTEVTDWPKLSWVAAAKRGCEIITILHGSCVETHASWCVEAVWDDEFSNGDFDRTDLVFGTGIRMRGDQVFFVSSGDTLNRLHWYENKKTIFVSNSLPALLAVADIGLVQDYAYADAMASITDGLLSYQTQIPSTLGPIHIVYYNNIRLKDDEISEVAKPPIAPDFIDFATYRDYLFSAARRIGQNASAPRRRHPVKLLSTVSSGYDSGAAAVVAREAGTRDAVTLSQARRDAANFFSLNDSGESVAMQLGMNCTSYDRFKRNYPFEDAAWAGIGNVGDINLAIFNYPKPLCLLFTGFFGDILWAKDTIQPEPLHRKDTSGARFSESRLELGVFNCSPAFWGCQKEFQILRLSHLPEMHPWTLDNDYDRPIPRRLLEEAGVKRGTFANKKRLASFNRRYGRPLSVDLREDFSVFLAQHGSHPGSSLSEAVALGLAGIDWLFLRKLPASLRFSCKDWIALPPPSLFFLWANERRKQRYLQGVK